MTMQTIWKRERSIADLLFTRDVISILHPSSIQFLVNMPQKQKD